MTALEIQELPIWPEGAAGEQTMAAAESVAELHQAFCRHPRQEAISLLVLALCAEQCVTSFNMDDLAFISALKQAHKIYDK